MSEPLTKMHICSDCSAELDLAEAVYRLNAAIDRINELEARYERHQHMLGGHHGGYATSLPVIDPNEFQNVLVQQDNPPTQGKE